MNPTQKHDVPRTKLSLARAARDEALRQRDACAEEAAALRLELDKARADFAAAQALAQETVKQVEAADEALKLAVHDIAKLRNMKAELVATLQAMRTHDSAAGPCDVPGLKCDCIARADAVLALARLDRSGQ